MNARSDAIFCPSRRELIAGHQSIDRERKVENEMVCAMGKGSMVERNNEMHVGRKKRRAEWEGLLDRWKGSAGRRRRSASARSPEGAPADLQREHTEAQMSTSTAARVRM